MINHTKDAFWQCRSEWNITSRSEQKSIYHHDFITFFLKFAELTQKHHLNWVQQFTLIQVGAVRNQTFSKGLQVSGWENEGWRFFKSSMTCCWNMYWNITMHPPTAKEKSDAQVSMVGNFTLVLSLRKIIWPLNSEQLLTIQQSS